MPSLNRNRRWTLGDDKEGNNRRSNRRRHRCREPASYKSLMNTVNDIAIKSIGSRESDRQGGLMRVPDKKQLM